MGSGSSWRALLWLVGIPITGLVLGHLAFWALVDLVGKDMYDEGTAFVVAVVGTGCFLVGTVALLARRAGKHPYAALGWGLGAAAAAGVIYVLFAIAFLATCDCEIG
jgi:hypothetical protein